MKSANGLENRAWRLRHKPAGLIQAGDLELVTERVPELAEGQVLLRLVHISLDPGQQVYMAADFELPGGTIWPGDVIRAWGVGQVIYSRSERFPVGCYARDHHGNLGVQEYAIHPEGDLVRVDPDIAPLSAQLGILGMPAITAHLGLSQIGRPKRGETVVVSGASGAVGSAAGQIARIMGCRVVGIAGGPEKCAFVTGELGFDACIDYKTGDLAGQLAAGCPEGIDIYFDVGGQILDTCLGQMAPSGRIIFCGAVAEYGDLANPAGLTNYLRILTHQLTLQGLAYPDYPHLFEPVLRELESWMRQGLLKHREDVAVGIENFVTAFHRLFAGQNMGKLVLQVREGVTQ